MAKKRKTRSRPQAARTPAESSTQRVASSAKRPPAKQDFRRLDLLLLGLCALGVALTLYLTGVKWLGEHPAYCNAGSACDLVQSSRWSTLFGMPMALWGLLTYLLLARYLWRLRTRASAWRPALVVAVVGCAVSWYLSIVSVVEIEATCMYCLASFILMNLLALVLLLRRPAHLPEHRWKEALPLPLGLAAVVVLALQLNFSGLFDPASGPEDPYLKALAQHLRDSGARFYGAYWCPHCQEQKALFEASVDRLPYVECTPSGREGPVNVACVNASVRDYPTWVIGDTRHGGVLSTRRLADLTGFRWDGPRR